MRDRDLEHPEITNCLRTGYPSWMQDQDNDDERYDDDDDSFGGYEDDFAYEDRRDSEW